MKENSHLSVVAPPWKLSGHSYMLVYRFSKEDIEDDLFLSATDKDAFCGGFGVVLLVNYTESNVGPYQEILCIPGSFRHHEAKHYTISRIFVSTMDSVVSGRANWAIPKDLAEFSFTDARVSAYLPSRDPDKTSRKPFYEAEFKAYGPRFPVSSKIMRPSLRQEKDGKEYVIRPSGHGRARLARVSNIEVDPEVLPAYCRRSPMVSFVIERLTLNFPEAAISKISK